MNNLNKDIADVIGEISKVANLINIEGKHHVFVEDLGHVQQLSVKIHKGGWKENAIPTLSQSIYYCSYSNYTKEEENEFQIGILKELKIIRDTLYKFFKNDQVSMKNRGYDIEKIKHYSFC